MKKNLYVIPIIFILIILMSSCVFNFAETINGNYSGNPNDYHWTDGLRSLPEKSAIIGLNDDCKPVVEILTSTLGVPPIIVGDRVVIPELLLPNYETWSNRIHVLDYSFKLEKTLEIDCLEMAGTSYVINDSLIYLSASTVHMDKAGCKAAIINLDTDEIWEYWLNNSDAPPKANAGIYNNTLYISDGPEGGAYNQYSIDGSDARMLMINLDTKEYSKTSVYHSDHPKDTADIVIDDNILYILFCYDHILEKWDLDTGTKQRTLILDDSAGLLPMTNSNPVCTEIWDYGDNLCVTYYGYQPENNSVGIYSYLIISKQELQYEYTTDFSNDLHGSPYMDSLDGDVAYIAYGGGIVNIATGEVLRKEGSYNKLE